MTLEKGPRHRYPASYTPLTRLPAIQSSKHCIMHHAFRIPYSLPHGHLITCSRPLPRVQFHNRPKPTSLIPTLSLCELRATSHFFLSASLLRGGEIDGITTRGWPFCCGAFLFLFFSLLFLFLSFLSCWLVSGLANRTCFFLFFSYLKL